MPYPIFVVYLSTNSNVSYLAPKGSLARSSTARANPEFLIEPGAPEVKLDHVCSLEFMAQFGRPLFCSFLDASGSYKASYPSEPIGLARAKLIGDDTIWGWSRSTVNIFGLASELSKSLGGGGAGSGSHLNGKRATNK
ncbi:hypothetical protein BS47DRAFT_1482237 [Hydnum rufescens UP504]|uniref:Uncharacterized protein n=1 Tax=Hydnum rufescens UP504 TaxID=1448309 RepID=A0A9P6B841_9AGAM|nr:hypothetical protein BS47DRAFT_1482237 [Hydnum rufescens UP504]